MKKIILFVFSALILANYTGYTQNFVPATSEQLLSAINSINNGIDIRFYVNDKSDIFALDQMVSVDRVAASPEGNYIVTGYLFPEKANDFLNLGIPFEMENIWQPKAYTMATTVNEMLTWDKYPTYTTYLSLMAYFQSTYPTLCKIDTIMASTPGGRKILAAHITSNVNVSADKPQFFYSSSIHGDEITGYYFMLRLIHYLLSNYGTITRVTNIVNNIDLWICPAANPDGTYNSGNNTVGNNPVSIRNNANGKDLNRNYPDPRTGNPTGTYSPIQPETSAFMTFASNHHFVMGANFHGGAEVVNYPWDTWTSSQKSHVDTQWWELISRQYADTAQTNTATSYMIDEDNGVTNGGDWYVITGGRQDYMNWWQKCREITIEVSTNKAVGTESLNTFWNSNYKSLLQLLEQSLYGFRGVVTDAQTGNPLVAKVFVNSHDADSSFVYSSLPIGNYHRPIKAGTYSVTYSAPCYQSQTHTITVQDFQTVRLDVALQQGANANFYAPETSNCTGVVSFVNQSDSSATGNQWLWSFGDGTTSTLANPSHTYANEGNYTVKLKITNSCGQVDSLIRTNYIQIQQPSIPSAQDVVRCGNGTVTLSAQGDNSIRWYNQATNGTLLAEGNSFTTPSLTQTTTYYVENYQYADTLKVGDTCTSTLGSYFTGTNSHGLYFNALSDLKIISVVVNAQTSSSRTITVYNSSNVQVATVTKTVPAGVSRVVVNFDIPQGNAYRITISATTGMYRKESGGTYSYSIPNLVEIYGNTANNLAYYYWFYDWQVQAKGCSSGRIPVQAIISTAVPENISTVAGPSSVCTGQTSVLFEATPSINANSYEWILPAGFIGQSDSSKILVNINSSAQSGNISVRGVNDCGNSAYKVMAVTVNNTPSIPGEITGSQSVCVGSNNVQYTIDNVAGADSYVWTYPSGYSVVDSSSASSIVFNIAQNAVSGTITVAGQNTCGIGASNSMDVIIKTVPTQPSAISGAYTVCPNISNIVYQVNPDSNVDSYQWTLPTGVSGSSNTNSISVSFASNITNGTISVAATNTCGTSPVVSYNFIVGSAPQSIGTINVPAVICQGNSNVLISVDPVANAESYLWSLPTGITGTSTTNSISLSIASNASSGIVSVAATNACGNVATNTLIYVLSKPAMVSVSQFDTVCIDQPFIVEVNTPNTNSFEWMFSNNLNGWSDSSSIVLTPYNGISGVYSVKLTNECGNITSGNYSVVLSDKPDVSYAYQTTGLTVDFYNQSTDFSQLLWNFGDGTTSTEQNPSHAFTSSGTYNIVLKASNSCGEDSVSHVVTVTNVGISELLYTNIKLFPNPTEDIINIVFEGGQNETMIEIFDFVGRKLYAKNYVFQTNQKHVIIPINEFSSGIYYVNIQGFEKPFKFVVK